MPRLKQIIFSLFLVSCAYVPAHAEESGRLTLLEENDSFIPPSDRHYTQGLKLGYLSGPVETNGIWDQSYLWLNGFLPIFEGSDRKRKYEWTIVGQSIFTPRDIRQTAPIPADRPYAAWLYTGAGLLQETKYTDYHTLENFEFLMGVVGPAALGETAQNDWHQFIGVNSALGWRNELGNEPAFLISYERKWRFAQPVAENLYVDVIPEAGVTGGNVLTYGSGGAMVRFGQNLAADYGPNRIRPSLSGTGWFDLQQLDGKFGWYIYAGTQGRAVARNIFLDGNILSDSASVRKKPFVADFTGGASLFWGDAAKIDFSVTLRTREFDGQKGDLDRFAGINIVLGL